MTYRRIYAGIGSRETPQKLEPLIGSIAAALARNDYTLRSGGAEGADSLFEKYSKKVEIFLPKKGFNNNPSRFCEPSTKAYEIAKKHHPAWDRCGEFARRAHARNSHIVLGKDLETPVDFIVCWTLDGEAVGGTGQALRIAAAYGITVSNLGLDDVCQWWQEEGLPQLAAA